MCSAIIHACCNRAVVIAAHGVPLLSKLCMTSHCCHGIATLTVVLFSYSFSRGETLRTSS